MRQRDKVPVAAPEMVSRLSYTWHAISPDEKDRFLRDRAMAAAMCEASLGELRVAYLRVCWAPPALVDEVFPSPTAWMAETHGWGFEIDSLDKLWLALVRHHPPARFEHLPPWQRPSSLDGVPEPARRDEDLADADQCYAGDFRRWREHFGVPFVAYVWVDDGAETGWNWRRHGIATSLYAQAATALAAEGLVLRASGNQSDDAKGLWAAFEAAGLVTTVRLPHPLPGAHPAVLEYRALDFGPSIAVLEAA